MIRSNARASFLVPAGLCALASLASAQTPPLSLSLQPPVVGPGDDIHIVVDGGIEGDYPVVLVSFDPGPISLPLVGTLQVGWDSLTIYPFPAFDFTGHNEFPCSLDCFAATVGPFYLQAVTLRFQNGVFSAPQVSDPLVFDIDDTFITDCDGNGIDDDCDLENGAPDCNGNGVPDACDIAAGDSRDANVNGVPDECEPCSAPGAVTQPGRWRVSNGDNSFLAPPAYGLRLDGLLDGDCSKAYTFDFELPGCAVWLDYDGNDVRVWGTAWGGHDTGSGWGTFEQSFLSIDVTYEDAIVRAGTYGPEVVVPAASASYGTVTWELDGSVIPVSGKANAGGIQFGFRQAPTGFESFGWFDLGAGCEADIPLGPMSGVDTCACGAPAKAGDEGSWRLGNKVVGQIAPPDYGLRLDGLLGDYPKQYTFDYERPGAGVYLTYDGSAIRIAGFAYGGLDIGGTWDPSMQGWIQIDVLWPDVIEDATGCELIVPNDASVTGYVKLLGSGTVVPLFGASNGAYQLRFFHDGSTVDLAGWVQYQTGKPGCCQDFNSHVATPIDDCPEPR